MFGALTTTVTVIMAPASLVLSAALGQHDVVLPPPLILKGTITGVAGLPTMQQ